MASIDTQISPPRTIRTGRIEPIETVLLLVALVVLFHVFQGLAGGGDGSIRDDASLDAQGSASSQLVNLAIFGSGLVLVLLRGMSDLLWRIVSRSWPLLLLLVLALVSTTWSIAPGTSFRRAVALTLSTSFAYFVVARFDIEEFLKILFLFFIGYMIVGILAVAVPGQGIATSGTFAGTWQGFTGAKNEFGKVLAIILAACAVYRIVGLPLWRTWWIPTAALASALLLLSQSKTPLMAGVAAVGGALFLRTVFRGRLAGWYVSTSLRLSLAIIVLVSAAVTLFIILPLIVEALGRDLTLSGRTVMWEWAAEKGWLRPWLGYGFRTFWIVDNTQDYLEVFGYRSGDENTLLSGSAPANGHSGYIDIWLELGILGCVVFAVFLFSLLRRMRDCFIAGALPAAYSAAMILSFWIVYSVSERVTLEHTEGAWFLFTVLYLYTDAELARMRQPIAAPQQGNRFS